MATMIDGSTINTIELNGVPAAYTKESLTDTAVPLQSGSLTKLKTRPMIINEHAESSREAMGVVDAATNVGQIFKASQDNINSMMLTLESAETETQIDRIEQANDAALQGDWVKTGTNLAVLENTIIALRHSSTKSMKLDMGSNNDLWKYTKGAGSWDMTGATIEFDYYQTTDSASGTMTFSIDDGVNTSVMTINVPVAFINSWRHFTIPISAFVGTANVAAITNVFFQVTTKKAGEFGYVDNVDFRPAPGSVEIELWDLGATLPVSGVYNYVTSGTQYTKIGDLGITGLQQSSMILPLKGGKQLYHLDNFAAGTALEYGSANEILNTNNYYAIILKYVDTDVTVFGPDTTIGTSYYTNGFAFTSVAAGGVITVIPGAAGAGAYSDLMFAVFSTQDIYVTRMSLRLVDANEAEAETASDTEANWAIEDSNMGMEVVYLQHHPKADVLLDLSRVPVFMEKGGKVEIYYSQGIDDNSAEGIMDLRFRYIPPTVHG